MVWQVLGPKNAVGQNAVSSLQSADPLGSTYQDSTLNNTLWHLAAQIQIDNAGASSTFCCCCSSKLPRFEDSCAVSSKIWAPRRASIAFLNRGTKGANFPNCATVSGTGSPICHLVTPLGADALPQEPHHYVAAAPVTLSLPIDP